jgi:hypothetical protein
MQEETDYLRKQENARMWTISLAASIMCCTVFSAVAFYFMSNLGQTLSSIDGRLASLEVRNQGVAGNPPEAPLAAAVPVPEPEMPSAAPLGPEPASLQQETVPAAPPPSNETPPAQMSTPPEGLFVPAPPSELPDIP